MRRVLVDVARARRSEKRGGNAVRVSLDEAMFDGRTREADVVRLDEGLDALARLDARKGRVIELRFFGAQRRGDGRRPRGVHQDGDPGLDVCQGLAAARDDGGGTGAVSTPDRDARAQDSPTAVPQMESPACPCP